MGAKRCPEEHLSNCDYKKQIRAARLDGQELQDQACRAADKEAQKACADGFGITKMMRCNGDQIISLPRYKHESVDFSLLLLYNIKKWRFKMAFAYKPLWKLLIDKEMTKKQLMEAAGISKSTMDKMGRGEQVSMDIIDRICNYFECDVSSVIEHISVERK